jgi:hypothetical protein
MSDAPSPSPSAAARGPVALAAIGAAVFVAGLFLSPAGVWPAYLLAVVLLTGAGLSGGLFAALHHLSGGRWAGPVLGVAEGMLRALPVAGVAATLLAFGAPTLYPWADPAAVAHDEVLAQRASWMTVPFVLARTVACFALWIAVGRVLARRSRRARERGDPASRAAAARAGAGFLVVLAPTFSVFCFDWVLSLERHFASTMFAVYHVAGLLSSGTAAVVLLAVVRRRSGRLVPGPAWEDTLHDLGKLLFGFCFFWGYVWFCQYMLIWYVNLPEETGHYALRHTGGWAVVAAANVALGCLVPMALLLARGPKRRETSLARAAAVVLVGRWVDLFLAIAPPLHGRAPAFGAWEVGVTLGAVGAFLWALGPGPVPAAPDADARPSPPALWSPHAN